MKVWAYLGIVLAVVGFGYWLYDTIYDAGYNAAIVAIKDDATKEQNAAIQKGIDDWVETNKDSLVTVVTEEKIVEKIRVVEKEVPKVIREIVEVKPECSRLGDAYLRVYNDAIRASNNHQGESAEPTGELVTGMQAIERVAFRSLDGSHAYAYE